MTVQTSDSVKGGMVQTMRNIREEISHEIKDMTFEEERTYLDKLLSEKSKADTKFEHKPKEIEEESSNEKA